jgi:hypothetical protein
MGGAYSTHGEEERETVYLENIGVDGIILTWVLKKWNGDRDWFVWIRIGTVGGLLRMR